MELLILVSKIVIVVVILVTILLIVIVHDFRKVRDKVLDRWDDDLNPVPAELEDWTTIVCEKCGKIPIGPRDRKCPDCGSPVNGSQE